MVRIRLKIIMIRVGSARDVEDASPYDAAFL